MLPGLRSLTRLQQPQEIELMSTTVSDSLVDAPVESAAGLKTAAGQEEVVAVVDAQKAFWINLALVRIFLPHLSF